MRDHRITKVINKGRLFSERETAEYIGVDVKTLQKWRRLGNSPPFLNPTKQIYRYWEREVVDWLDSNRQNSVKEVEI